MSKKPKSQGLFPEGYWDRPKPQPKGDARSETTFQAVGAALTVWESTEETLEMLCFVFSEISDAHGYDVVRQIFGTIESSAGRRKAIENLSELYFGVHKNDPIIKTPFNQLMNAFSSASKLRDDIAHGKVTHFRMLSGDKQDCGAFLFPSEYNTNRTHPHVDSSDQFPFNVKRAKYRYTSSDINDILVRFGRLREAILTYTGSIHKIDGLLPLIPDKVMKAQTHPETSE